ncbi:MAG: GNAT family N-acetyltransferase, partial [Actinobacteria bacterium]|nr:GNAT family N-acetyltransferase [Actinomycetota bacterium]
MNIRPAKQEDAGAILQLIKDLALYEKAPEEVKAT